jgi:hypothetical protein
MQLKFATQNIVGYEVFEIQTAAQQIIGREGETATFIRRCPLNFNLREFGFAPRQLNRYAFSVSTGADFSFRSLIF